jgi:hypothetical protein
LVLVIYILTLTRIRSFAAVAAAKSGSAGALALVALKSALSTRWNLVARVVRCFLNSCFKEVLFMEIGSPLEEVAGTLMVATH